MAYPFLSEKYEIVNQIGQGAFGESYLVKDNDTSDLRLIKIIENEKIWNALKKNENLLSNIDNEYIMHIYGIKLLRSYKCIIGEYVVGCNLNTFIHENDLLLDDILNISFQVLNAIHYLYKLGLSHKDIKPSNIVFDKEKNLAKLVDLDYMFVMATSNQNFIGTIKYSSPEQIISSKPSSKADIYSLGLVLCNMIIGDIPFDIDLNKMIFQIKEKVERTLRKIPDLTNSIADKLITLINGLIEYKPENRLNALEAIEKIVEIRKICNENNQGNVLIHDHKSGALEITDDSINFHSMLESSYAIMDSRTVCFFEDGFLNSSSADDKHDKRSVESAKLVKFSKIKEETKNIYRDQLLKEYDNILMQAKVSFWLWVSSFVICFVIIFLSIYSILKGNYIEGIITIVLDGAVVAIQKLFNIREDYYRKLMEQKMKHLETGDYLDYAFEKVEKLDSSEDKNKEILELIKTIREHAKKYDD